MSPSVLELDDPAAFLEATSTYRSADPIRTNVMGSTATAMLEGIQHYDEPRFYVVAQGDDVLGAAMRTPPHPLHVGPMPRVAAEALGANLADDPLELISGPRVELEVLAEAMAWDLRATRIVNSSLLYGLGALRVPAASCEVVLADASHREALRDFMAAFHEEVGTRVVRDDVDARIAAGTLYVGLLEDQPVAFAGHAAAVRTPAGEVVRIGPVYTPPAHRRRGHAATIVSHICELVLARSGQCCLFTDPGNPTSNHVYRDLGFELIDEYVDLHRS